MIDDENEPSRGWKPLKFEVDQYMHHLDDSDLTEEEKIKFLEALWNFVAEFMSIGFETHPAQQAVAARKGEAATRPNAGDRPKRR